MIIKKRFIMKKALVDLPVLLIFFARPDTFKQVFERVKEARPSKLFLACDGPRDDRPDDLEKINACKKIAEDIDWECEVYTDYSEKNLGCGPRPQSAISWALGIVDRIVVLEDDCVPEVSLFGYMKELLERYKDDERICAVSGFNHFKDWDCGEYSYFFTKTGATLGWGTWRRVWDKYDFHMKYKMSQYDESLLYTAFDRKKGAKLRIEEWKSIFSDINKRKKIDYWDLQFGFVKYTQSMMTIVPKHNMIYNVGLGEGSTHAEKLVQKGWHKGDILLMPVTEMKLPLSHPEFVIADGNYDAKYYREMKCPSFVFRVIRKIKNIMRGMR